MRKRHEDYNMKKIRKKWENMNLFSKCSYLSVCLLFFLIPFTGLVLESLNISIIKFEIILGIYILSIIFSMLAKKWKLMIIATVGALLLWAITIGIAEILWYYYKAKGNNYEKIFSLIWYNNIFFNNNISTYL